MSFEPNDMNAIHLGNYEEFFILYMDNELTGDQVKMVDEFLLAHPDLKAEFEILMSTKLPLEDFSFDKKDLLSDNMKQTLVDEELLLYIDNELPADKKKTVELEIASDKDYQLQHHLLLQTKLDPSEKIEYPNKKELYRRTERIIAMKVWMRVAAAVVIITIGGILYFKNSSSTITPNHSQNTAGIKNKPVQHNVETKKEQTNPVSSSSDNTNNDQVVAIKSSSEREIKSKQSKEEKETVGQNQTPKLAVNDNQQEEQILERPTVKNIQFNGTKKLIASVDHNELLNTNSVTSLDPNRTTISGTPTKEQGEPNDRKGSVKGFLRKATRMIEKRTGIDPTNENGELLIGAVAINLVK